MTLFHGGVRGIKVGEHILPPKITKAPCLSDFGAESVHRRDRVYLTTSYSAALLYAAGVNGFIYECEALSELEKDPDCTQEGLSYQCEKAKVLRIIKPSNNDIKRALKALIST